jgi:hypothetical protein
MLKIPAVILLVFIAMQASAQKLDSIFFNLYTDSLKRGTYNYINVEGKYSDGTYLPLGDKELQFSSSSGSFSGNNLFIDSAVTDEKIRVKVVLKENPAVTKEMDIYIKKYEPNEKLPTKEEILRGKRRKNRS